MSHSHSVLCAGIVSWTDRQCVTQFGRTVRYSRDRTGQTSLPLPPSGTYSLLPTHTQLDCWLLSFRSTSPVTWKACRNILELFMLHR